MRRSSRCGHRPGTRWPEPTYQGMPEEGPGEAGPRPTALGPTTVPSSREYKVLNCVRLGLAAVVLLVLAGILVDAQCGGAGPSEDAVTEAREPPPGGLARGGHSDGSEAPLRDPEPQ
ncbi:uncharacterized protein LOC102500939 [Tupaia chinensis]|uniref:uncharacterized protein LOC102500939 n=1 Tax=Tupaia chinensis TaxID=246437 RepID=UPI000FFC1FB4|nr:uncharacterized protein LOC102500939 [Tupaia chinensis]